MRKFVRKLAMLLLFSIAIVVFQALVEPMGDVPRMLLLVLLAGLWLFLPDDGEDGSCTGGRGAVV